MVIDHNQELLERVRENYPDIRVVENQEARGLSGSRNSGIAAARGEILAFVDDNAEASPDWLSILISGYADPNVYGVGGSIEPLWSEERPAWFQEEFNWKAGSSNRRYW